MRHYNVHLISSLTSACIVQHWAWDRNTAPTLSCSGTVPALAQLLMSWPRFTMKKRADLRLVCLNMTDRWFGLLMPVQVLRPLSKCLLRALDQVDTWNKARRLKKWCHKQARLDEDGFRPPPQTEILPLWPWPWCRRTCLECLSQSDTWVEMWFPPHLQSHNYRLFFFRFFFTSSAVNTFDPGNMPAAESHQSAERPCRRSSPCSAGLYQGDRCTAAVWSLSQCTRLPVEREHAKRWLSDSLFFFTQWLAATAKMSFKSVNVKTFVSFYGGGGEGGEEIKKTETVTVFFDTWMWRCVVCFVFCLFYY